MGFITRKLECRVPPLAQVVIVAVAMWLLAGGAPPPSFSFLDGLALTFVAAGATLSLLGVREFRRSATTVDPRVPARAERLVVGGVYRLSRNPMYAGFLLALLGWAVFLRHPLAPAMLPVFVCYMNRFQILPEERAMQEKFGEAFAAYRARVRRWL